MAAIRMNFWDKITLQAFSLTRLQLDSTLSRDLEAIVHRVGRAIAKHQPGVAEEVRDLVNQHQCLRKPFEDACTTLQTHYQQQRVAQADDAFNDAWEHLVADILTAEDPRATVKEFVGRIQTQPEFQVWSDIPSPFLTTLHKELVALDQQAIAVLAALERQLLNVEDLAYALEIPLEQAKRTVENLWNHGYIDSTKSNMLNRVMRSLHSPMQRQHLTDLKTHFVLTPKGHFYLHPLVRHRPLEGAA